MEHKWRQDPAQDAVTGRGLSWSKPSDILRESVHAHNRIQVVPADVAFHDAVDAASMVAGGVAAGGGGCLDERMDDTAHPRIFREAGAVEVAVEIQVDDSRYGRYWFFDANGFCNCQCC